jgi:hypothetical protein
MTGRAPSRTPNRAPKRPETRAEKRGGGLSAVARPLDRLTRPLLKSRSAVEATVMLEWARIVDAETAANARPEKLRFSGPKEPGAGRTAGTLHLLVAPAYAPTLQHSSRQLVERINRYLGWSAVGRLALRQGPIPRMAVAERPRPRALRAEEEQEIEQATAAIEDERLRGALARLARAVKAKQGG